MYLGIKLVAFGALLYGQTLNSHGARNLRWVAQSGITTHDRHFILHAIFKLLKPFRFPW